MMWGADGWEVRTGGGKKGPRWQKASRVRRGFFVFTKRVAPQKGRVDDLRNGGIGGEKTSRPKRGAVEEKRKASLKTAIPGASKKDRAQNRSRNGKHA